MEITTCIQFVKITSVTLRQVFLNHEIVIEIFYSLSFCHERLKEDMF